MSKGSVLIAFQTGMVHLGTHIINTSKWRLCQRYFI